MMFPRFLAAALAAFLGLCLGGPGFADDLDQASIQNVMHGMFDRPDTELVIDPIVVEGGFSVAGWTQGDMGGRAFLRKRGSEWSLVLCTGDEIRSAEALTASGVPADTAARLAADIAEVEKTVDAERLKMFASFQGVVQMEEQPSH